MFAKIAKEFQDITKFDLLQYFLDYKDFLINDFPDVYNYYSGNVENIDARKLKRIENLLSRSNDLSAHFSSFAGKLGNMGYWDLQEYCQGLKDTLERISKLPKYLRTSKSYRGYKPFVQVREDVGGYRTIQDIAEEYRSVTEEEIIMNNDLQESDYDIKDLSTINNYVDNRRNVVVTTILEEPVGKRVYGRDIQRKITFVDNDLATVEYENNIVQKVEVLLELNKGDIPEMPNFGKNIASGQDNNSYSYAELLKDLSDNFLQNDLFDSVEVEDINASNGDINVVVKIKTKYEYSLIKQMQI